jgi:hypothetical protein
MDSSRKSYNEVDAYIDKLYVNLILAKSNATIKNQALITVRRELS